MAIEAASILSVDASDRSTPRESVEFVEMLKNEMPFLRRIVRRWHRDDSEADDLVQDTLVRALAGAHLWQQGSDVRAWLFSIMRNQFLSSVAAAARHGKALWQNQYHYDGFVAEQQSMKLELRDLQAALKRLPAKQRLAILLVALEGQSYESAAAAMHTSVGAVRCHLARGRERLRAVVRSTTEHTPLKESRVAQPRAQRTSPLPSKT